MARVRPAQRRVRGRWLARGLLLGAAALGAGSAPADWWSENFEVHGYLTTKLYARSRSFDLGDSLKISSWRTELNLEPELRLYSGRDFSLSFYGVFRPIYDAVYEIHPHTWGGRVGGGRFGTGGKDLVLIDLSDGSKGEPFGSDAVRGKKFPGHGNCVLGEFCLANADTGTFFEPDPGDTLFLSDAFDLLDPTTSLVDPEKQSEIEAFINEESAIPAMIIDDTVFFGRVTAPIRPVPPSGKIGGDAHGEKYVEFLHSSARVLGAFASLQSSLAPAVGDLPAANRLAALAVNQGTFALENSLFKLASRPLSTPLNFYAGALGSRMTLNEQAPFDFNRNENRLKFDCFDNAHPWCAVREAYLSMDWRDLSIRIGKQQVVWGKTDAFRLQDNINPMDLGYRNVFPELEDRRIPQLALDVIYGFGDVGPLQDLSLEFVWLFDRFRPWQFGQCGEPYAYTVACQGRTDASAHHLFNFALAGVEQVPWNIRNTEPGLRVEFRTPRPSIAFSLSAFWTRQDLPVGRFTNLYSVNNPNAAAMLFVQGLGLGSGIELLARDPLGFGPWTNGFDPYDRDGPRPRPGGSLDEANQVLLRAWRNAINADPPPVGGCGNLPKDSPEFISCVNGILPIILPWTASEVVLEYPRVLTLGASIDYQIPRSDTILRAELAYDFDRGINDTSEPDGVDSSDVFLAAIGIDRPTYIPFLNRTRTAFLSFQTFFEHVIDYDDEGFGNGMVVPETQIISTAFMQNYWRSDSLILTNFVAYDWNAGAWITGPSFRWLINQNFFIDVGLNVLWGGKDRRHNIRDMCADGTLGCLGDPETWNPGQWQGLQKNLKRAPRSPWFSRQGFADQFMEDRDEIWVGFTYQF